ncbi:unnamed protein product [Strongylus vulgaris]|uniref:ShKT domain-containing protein n=1 Tax=Strongylus vulgaris TaxID=40348 RepID=A0A3P7JQW2_STRVU|nr:unnamed protein product [Strongylus vulgaris]
MAEQCPLTCNKCTPNTGMPSGELAHISRKTISVIIISRLPRSCQPPNGCIGLSAEKLTLPKCRLSPGHERAMP